MSVWHLAGAFVAGWATCFVGWLLSREHTAAATEIDLRDDAAATAPRHAPA